ncbi:hypothetical protein COOONC_20955 [Cooperia oncophora]
MSEEKFATNQAILSGAFALGWRDETLLQKNAWQELNFTLVLQCAVTTKYYKRNPKAFIKQCSKQETLSFNQKIADFDGDEFNVFFSKLKKFEVCIRVEGTKIIGRLGLFQHISQKAGCWFHDLAAIVIIDNPYLEEIVFGRSNRVRADALPTLMVRGNRKLSNNTITRLKELKARGRASKRNSIQEFGGYFGLSSNRLCNFPRLGKPRRYNFTECTVPEPLKNLNDLIGCELLHGDIRVRRDQQSLLPPREPLKPFTLTGCVMLKNSKIENIDFLRNLQELRSPRWICDNEIINNTNLCIHEDFERILRSRIDKHDMDDTPEDCELSFLRHFILSTLSQSLMNWKVY